MCAPFEFFGGIPKILRPDNPKTGVKSPNYYEPDLNPTYQEMAEYYQVAVLPARVQETAGQRQCRKRGAERRALGIGPAAKPDLLQPGRSQPGDPNRWWKRSTSKIMAHLGKSRRQLFEELDQPELRPLPEKPYEFAIWKTARGQYRLPCRL